VFENRVLRRIFIPKRDEVTGGWRKLHNEWSSQGGWDRQGMYGEVKEDEECI
jgi:hypothetical protein